LATKICNALKVHTTIEEEIFYPAFLEASDDVDIHHEAEIEHRGAKNLISEIEACSPDDEYFEPTVKVLSEMIKHHVKEEEKPGGMFSVARESKMDLVTARRRARRAQGRARKRRRRNGHAAPGCRRARQGRSAHERNTLGLIGEKETDMAGRYGNNRDDEGRFTGGRRRPGLA
jgi:hypothetical protein